jgi:hypothetical protein
VFDVFVQNFLSLLCLVFLLLIYRLLRKGKGKWTTILGLTDSSHIRCEECKLVVARYDERGVCHNCVSEGK